MLRNAIQPRHLLRGGVFAISLLSAAVLNAVDVANGYDLDGIGSGNGDRFPVSNVSWYQVVKWCNARSEMEGGTPVHTVNGSTYKSGDAAPDVNEWCSDCYPGYVGQCRGCRGGSCTQLDLCAVYDPGSVTVPDLSANYRGFRVARSIVPCPVDPIPHSGCATIYQEANWKKCDTAGTDPRRYWTPLEAASR